MKRRLLALLLGLAWLGNATAQELVLGVQPILGEAQTRAAYEPLARYLSDVTGKKFTLRTYANFLTYWQETARGSASLYLDAAHFTDYRASKMGYQVLAKVPDSVSYSLVVRDGELVFEASELVGRKIATLGQPSIGAARLESLFTNPLRQPIVVEVADSNEAVRKLLNNEVYAAMIPSPLVSAQMAGEGGITVVSVTPQIPHIALSASASVTSEVREQIRQAVIDADKSPEGQKMLQGIGFARFDPADQTIYAGQSDILKDTWGF
ncbi:MAG: phosphate/phosphite/phosphonate ABC transporter substrate-binding protein [Gammaproteobacteria bacterium]|nr:phosphate/phosphite/phosphonate ABC transporter substrate-binding protein [Gammaproteobacteria bacterium]